MKLYWKSYWVYTVKKFIGYLFSLYYCCFMCLRLAKPKVQLKSVLMILTLNELFQKIFQVFYFTPQHSISLTLPPFPIVCFFHYSVCNVRLISDCNHPFDTSTVSHTVSQEYIIAIENAYLNEVFLKSKFSIFP